MACAQDVGAARQYIKSVCVSECVLAADAVYTLCQASECTKGGVNGTVKLAASCDKVRCRVMLRTFICTYCPKGMFSVCF